MFQALNQDNPVLTKKKELKTIFFHFIAVFLQLILSKKENIVVLFCFKAIENTIRVNGGSKARWAGPSWRRGSPRTGNRCGGHFGCKRRSAGDGVGAKTSPFSDDPKLPGRTKRCEKTQLTNAACAKACINQNLNHHCLVDPVRGWIAAGSGGSMNLIGEGERPRALRQGAACV